MEKDYSNWVTATPAATVKPRVRLLPRRPSAALITRSFETDESLLLPLPLPLPLPFPLPLPEVASALNESPLPPLPDPLPPLPLPFPPMISPPTGTSETGATPGGVTTPGDGACTHPHGASGVTTPPPLGVIGSEGGVAGATPGEYGATGAYGAGTGATTATGATGTAGGVTGATGTTGGVTGAMGATGGVTGAAGVTGGDTGATGVTGGTASGDTGCMGA